MPAELNRSLNLPLVTFYGIGTILGAGIYVLVGKVAGLAGLFTPFSFLAASFIAALSALSYGELSARFPKSAGEAYYVEQALHWHPLSTIIGLAIVAAGIVSVATLLQGLAGYLNVFISLDKTWIICLAAILMGGVVSWGITQSVVIASAMTLLEIAGLLLILWITRDKLATLPANWSTLIPPLDSDHLKSILAGAFIAFYAFIGFEDIVNVAEEVRNPEQNLPRAIVIALIVTSTFYVLVAIASVLTMTPDQLSGSDAPLADMYQLQTGAAPTAITLISLVSILNGVIIQVIMASRVLYGMGAEGWLPAGIARINAKTRTPVTATLTVTVLVLGFALWLPLLSLATLTSFIVLSVFSLINLSLIMVKVRDSASTGHFQVPLMIPILGAAASVGFVLFQLLTVFS